MAPYRWAKTQWSHPGFGSKSSQNENKPFEFKDPFSNEYVFLLLLIFSAKISEIYVYWFSISEKLKWSYITPSECLISINEIVN